MTNICVSKKLIVLAGLLAVFLLLSHPVDAGEVKAKPKIEGGGKTVKPKILLPVVGITDVIIDLQIQNLDNSKNACT